MRSARFIIPVKLLFALAVWLAGGASIAIAATPHSHECIVPSKPGGGFDLTCKLAQRALADAPSGIDGPPMRLTYLPGGIGAVAWNSIVTQRRGEADTLVAFSGGSILNLALGKFGNGSIADVRWVAAVGTDYGMIAVRNDSPYRNLADLVSALKKDPRKVPIGAGGTIGSQDWLKVVQITRQVGVDPKSLRFVAFEGGGEAFTALLAGHVQAVSGDASEAVLHSATDRIRVLAVLSDARLPGPLSNVPTAREQGFDLTWPILRGFYMGPDVPDADYRRWVDAFNRTMADKKFDALRASAGLYPFALTGAPLTAYVKNTEASYRRLAKEFGLLR